MQPDRVGSLRGELAEDEQAARLSATSLLIANLDRCNLPNSDEWYTLKHHQRWEPRRVLALVRAHRSILAEYETLAAECQGEPESAAILAWVERVVLPALASAYSAEQNREDEGD